MPIPTILGIHHVTAITADAQKNIDFYTGVLGQRLVKITVNFDDPSSYHLYYGDDTGSPGSIMTFFAWPGAFEGRKGPPQVTVIAYAAPRGSQAHWQERLAKAAIKTDAIVQRFGDDVIGFADPDGMRLEIVFSEAADGATLSGFHGATISEEGYERTARLLTETMGFQGIGEEQNRYRFATPNSPRSTTARSAAGHIVDVICVPGAQHGTMGAGAVHHIAFRTADDAQQVAWRDTLTKIGRNVSPVMDRKYFHSIYFREPGGVLFEIATDSPGFAVDEPAEHLGEKLTLPAWFEEHREQINRALPAVKLPSGATIGGRR
jgi:glyoxalase family protein